VHYDADGELELCVKVPSVVAASDTELYLYYGNAAAAETTHRRSLRPGTGASASSCSCRRR